VLFKKTFSDMFFTVYFKHDKMLKENINYISYNNNEWSFIISSFLQKADDFPPNYCIYQTIHNTAWMKVAQEYIEENY
jgi:hypothetical protein